MPKLRKMRLGRATYLVNKDIGYFPYFTLTLRHRIKNKMAVNVAVVGEAGIGKSYLALTLCAELDPTFSVDQIVFFYSEYIRLLRKLPMGKPIMFDEPSYAMGKREWYKQINKVLVKTIESQRFLVHPLFVPIINMTLLDKTVRDHLIQYAVYVLRKGYAFVYRIYPSQWEEKVYRSRICTLKTPIIGKCKRDSCLGCRKLPRCNELRAKYERKKAEIQLKRYEQAEEEASKIESKELTTKQLADIAYSFKQDIIDEDGKLNVKRMRIILMQKLRLHISIGRGYDIKELLKMTYPDEIL